MRRDSPIEALWRYSIPYGAPAGGQHFIIPETTLNIVFYRTFCRAGINSNENIFLLGPVSTTTSFALAPGHELTAARIKPEWATYLLGIAPEDVTDLSVLLKDVCPPLAWALLPAYEQNSDSTQLLQGLEESILGYADAKLADSHCFGYVSHAVELMRRSGGRVNQKSLAIHLGISDRQLRRSVRDMIGVTPKGFNRVTRFLKTVLHADANEVFSWSDLAVNFGYFDQAHLINDFKALSGLTPTQLMKARRAESVFSNSQ